MGSSGWVSRVPYQPDIEAALQAARWEAFRTGNYYHRRRGPQARSMTEDEYVAWFASTLDDFSRSMCGPEYYMCREEWRAAQIDPVDPDSLLDSYEPNGSTVSVIDMLGVDDSPSDYMVAPVPVEWLRATFGTSMPGTAEVEAVAGTCNLNLYGRNRGAYIFGYRDGVADTIFFVGFTGD